LAQIVLMPIAMGAKRVEDLIVWQLANELKIKVYELTETGPASKDWKFRDELRDAVSSTTRNIREGFGRLRHKEFAQFLRYSRGSLYETSDGLHDGVARKYWTPAQIEGALILSKRATKANSRFTRYLRNNPDPYWID
jgi:four helix bundle protein